MKSYLEHQTEIKRHYANLAEHAPDPKAADEFKRPAYAARKLIRHQGKQIETEVITGAEGTIKELPKK